MKNMIDNDPWKTLSLGSKRRVDSNSKHNIYWFVDNDGKYGLHIVLDTAFDNVDTPLNIKGISTTKLNDSNVGKYYLLLNNNSDQEIFKNLCNDIISTCSNVDQAHMVLAIESRLIKWQHFLKSGNKVMTTEMQMGLFSELCFINEFLVHQYTIDDAINGWCGPERDLIDFNLHDCLYEIKSYKSNNGPVISISSNNQLFSDDKPLKLITYGLTSTDVGLTVIDLYNEIIENHLDSTPYLINVLENKMIEYGCFPDSTKMELIKFKVDSIRKYKIEDGFPRILQNNIPNGIIRLKYSIDLHFCSAFEIE